MSSRRPLVKICGVTRPEDAEAAVALGVSLLGLNFWPRSPRFVESERASEILAAVAGRVPVVGVFVDEEPARIQELRAELGFDLVQLHGDEPPADLAHFRERSIRALRFDWTRSLSFPSLNLLSLFEHQPHYLLIDAPAGERFGGTGEPWEWALARPVVAASPVPVLVAGGIRPESARTALAASGAAGIDVASGVESAPGIKDAEKMRRLMAELAEVAEGGDRMGSASRERRA